LTAQLVVFQGESAEDQLTRHTMELEAEKKMWKEIYPSVSSKIRVATLNKKPALLLPHFDHPKDRKDPVVVAAIRRTLEEDYFNKGLTHGDIAWRNIGIRREGAVVSAVVFDMETVKREKPEQGWVDLRMQELKDRAG
jgi:hypothetical protein